MIIRYSANRLWRLKFKGMKNFKTAINISFGFLGKVPVSELAKAAREAGFDAIFPLWNKGEDLAPIYNEAVKNGLRFQSIHAPFYCADKMWEDNCPRGDEELEDLIKCLDDCVRFGAPIMVCHVIIGRDEGTPTEKGIERYSILLDEAEKRGIKIAFENTEGECYLEYIKDKLWDKPAAGFCIDTGHELCYNRGRDMIRKYGANGKLISTHLNDNFGMTGNSWTPKDDSHILPFDGIVDWEGVAERIKEVGIFDEYLTFELTSVPKEGKNTHDIYDGWDYKRYFREAHDRAMQFEAIIEK